MKINRFRIFSIASFLFLTYSCAPVYKCGESQPAGFAAGNRLMDVVTERDELCETNKNLENAMEVLTEKNKGLMIINDSLVKRNGELIGEYDVLNRKYVGLQEDYKALEERNLGLRKEYSSAITENLTQGHLYDERLKEKERRLDLKEKELQLKEQEIIKREQIIKELEAEIARRDSIVRRLNQMLEDALLGFNKEEVNVEIKEGKIYISLSEKLLFASGKAEVQEKGQTALSTLGKVLSRNENFEIHVEGHTDNVPIKTAQFKDNWDLSTARATSVVRILQTEGALEPSRLTASGKGEYVPKVANDTPENRAKNRRTEIILTPNLTELLDYLGK